MKQKKERDVLMMRKKITIISNAVEPSALGYLHPNFYYIFRILDLTILDLRGGNKKTI